jgi:hypothetical protein
MDVSHTLYPVSCPQLDEVKSLGKDHFGAASVICPQIREHVKLTFLPVPRADDDVDEAEVGGQGGRVHHEC